MGNLLLSRKAGQSVQLESPTLCLTVEIGKVSATYVDFVLYWHGRDYLAFHRVGLKESLSLKGFPDSRLTVLTIGRKQAKLAFEAPIKVQILRTELLPESLSKELTR